jgi:hypothetical protein
MGRTLQEKRRPQEIGAEDQQRCERDQRAPNSRCEHHWRKSMGAAMVIRGDE